MAIDKFMQECINSKIESCKKASYKELDLRKLRLDAVPPEVYELGGLQELNLSSDNIIGGSNIYFGEEYWWEVSHDNNSITFIDEDLGNLHSLEVLCLDQIELDRLPESIGDLGLLKHLSIRNNGLDSLPDSICNLTNLEFLDASFNLLNQLPKNFAKLKKLKELNLYGCAFSEVPEQVLQLPALKKINFGTFNKKEIWEDTREKFFLVGNSIIRIPMELFKSKTVESVGVENLELEGIEFLQ